MAKMILLTGANGFVGSHIADALLSRGDQVRAMVRTTSNLEWLQVKPVSYAYATLQDRVSLEKAVEGVDAIIHNAGIVTADHKYLYYLHNSEGTRNLLEAIVEVNPKISRFVYISSQAAGGPTDGKIARKEDEPPKPITHYGKSKLVAEGHLKRFQDKIPVTIIRPPSIYGPRDTAFLPLFKLITNGWEIQIGRRREITFTHVQDLARQVLLQLDHPQAVNELFHAAPFSPVTLETFIQTIIRLLGATTRKVIIPNQLIKPGYALAYPLLQLFGVTPPLTPDKLDDLLQLCWTINGAKAQKLLGFEGKMPLEAGIGQTIEWFRWKKWLKSPRDRLRDRGDVLPYPRSIGGKQRLYDPACDLCALGFDGDIKTKKHYEDQDFVIVDCLICREPMAVLKEHRSSFSEMEKERLLCIFKNLFGNDKHPDFTQRRIPTHAHVHYRLFPHCLPWQKRPM